MEPSGSLHADIRMLSDRILCSEIPLKRMTTLMRDDVHITSPETAEFFDFMMENQLFDVLGRKTKKAGGYMTYLPLYHAPFIFANFNGTSGDVDVITHECGHAFQGYLAAQDPPPAFLVLRPNTSNSWFSIMKSKNSAVSGDSSRYIFWRGKTA